MNVPNTYKEVVNSENYTGAQRYGVILLLALSLVATSAFSPSTLTSQFLVLTAGLFIVPIMLWLMQASRHLIRVSYFVLTIGLVIGILAYFALDHIVPGQKIYAIVQLFLIALVIFSLLATVVKNPKITLQTIMGAAALYVFIGILFARVFYAMDLFSGPFFAQNLRVILPSDYVYYSFVTLNTIGYGDLTAAGQIGKLLSVLEATIGQLYLVTVLALIVGNLGADIEPHLDRARNIRVNRKNNRTK